ncbi:hypothetical protein [Cytobacillus purgationiresistens]|uniref:Uncharacterized protein n=1 Tax=Cytobacillus purgationiresistens TaxID=863449 RepID=A0ABU0AGJ9_9BACI|nr:hypothetical protein [Cytobacillus purgationiresistens]MDQ0269917.1 hypothetical protein [Cytobacillus purgationiresistens]
MKYEPLGFIESGVTYHICADKKTVTVTAKIGAVVIKCTGVTFKETIAEAKRLINNELHSKI